MKIRIILAQVLLILTSVTAAVLADGLASPGGVEISWTTIDAGGGNCLGAGSLELSATIGQPDASVALVGGAFELVGGFWPGVIEPGTVCPADIAGNDGIVNIDDLLLVINHWGQGSGSPGDINHIGGVNIDDLLAVVNAWGACP